MKILGTKTIKLSTLIMPGDFKQAMSAPETRKIESSYEVLGGHIQDPVVRVIDGKHHLIAGRKRTAAHMNRKKESMEAKLVECTDREAKLVELIENACRRHDRDEQGALMTQLVDLMEQDVAQERAIDEHEGADKPKRGPGRPKTVRGEARDRAAKVTGIKPDSVRKAEARHAAREEERNALGAAPPIDVLGMDMDAAFLGEVLAIKNYVNAALGRVRLGMGELRQLQKAEIDFPPGVLQKAYGLLQDAHTLLKGYVPGTLCPYCKGVDGYQQECTACRGVGWLGKLEAGSVPEELLKEGMTGFLMDRGQLVALADVIDPTPEPYEGVERQPNGDVDWPPAEEGEDDYRVDTGDADAVDELEEDEETVYSEDEVDGEEADLPW